MTVMMIIQFQKDVFKTYSTYAHLIFGIKKILKTIEWVMFITNAHDIAYKIVCSWIHSWLSIVLPNTNHHGHPNCSLQHPRRLHIDLYVLRVRSPCSLSGCASRTQHITAGGFTKWDKDARQVRRLGSFQLVPAAGAPQTARSAFERNSRAYNIWK